jgi:hypothetical protein
MSDDPLLDHLEKTFADAYRKEIDQEENVWRSLPFLPLRWRWRLPRSLRFGLGQAM